MKDDKAERYKLIQKVQYKDVRLVFSPNTIPFRFEICKMKDDKAERYKLIQKVQYKDVRLVFSPNTIPFKKYEINC